MFVDGLIFILITKKINFNKFNNLNYYYSIQNILKILFQVVKNNLKISFYQ